ncbi:MAG: hypothetical protein WKG07_05285 [Hymenobacter sp.]
MPVAAGCAGLAATGNCCNYGLTRVRLGTIDNTSADGSAGYQDFTCPQRTSLMVGMPYPLLLTTGGTNAHDTRAWLDLNNDGVFTAEELVGEALNTASPSLTLTRARHGGAQPAAAPAPRGRWGRHQPPALRRPQPGPGGGLHRAGRAQYLAAGRGLYLRLRGGQHAPAG